VSGPAWAKPFLEAHRAELVALRRQLHAHPELSYEERETTDLLAQRLQIAGLQPVLLPNECGLTCDIGSGDGPVVALRADIDALAMDDEKDVPYRSQREGVAHACGHDVHATVVLGAGLALAELLAESGTGRVRLIFEPAEESLPGGAIEVIDSGGLDDVVSIFGLHCDPKVDVGSVAVRTGPLTSATDMVTIELHGPGGHTARPQLTVDLVSVAARVAGEVPKLVHEAFPGQGPGLLVFGALRAGDAVNVIPSHAVLRGTFRTPDRDVWSQAEPVVRAAVERVLDDTGAEWDLVHRAGIPPVVNDPEATACLADAAADVVGDGRVVEAAQSLGGDSFAWFAERVPASYARLGVHDPASTERLDLHSSTFDVDERAIDVGVQVLVETARRALRDYETAKGS
jgi:amidohydrolase